MIKFPARSSARRFCGSRAVAVAFAAMVVSSVMDLADAAAGQSIREYPIPTVASSPAGIASGPDGNLWFTEVAGNKIGRITPAGVISEFPIPTPGSGPLGITTGPDGNLWFTESVVGNVARITTAGVVTEFPVPFTFLGLGDIAAGSDGNLWFSASSGYPFVGRLTTAGSEVDGSSLGVEVGNSPPGGAGGVTVGADGNIWTTAVDRIARITTDYEIDEFPITTADSGASQISSGPDGNLWFTESKTNQIGRISTAGVVTEFPIGTSNSGPVGITAGSDGDLWFAESAVNQIGRMTTGGVLTEFVIPTAASAPSRLVAGPDGNIWFTETAGNRIARITATVAPCPPGGTTLCLDGGRFQVEASWTGPDGASSRAHAERLTSNTGYFWFFDPNDVEVAIKILDGCAVNGHSWVFSAGLTNVAVTLTVTDTSTNQARTYSNLQGAPFQTIADTTTFAACASGTSSGAAPVARASDPETRRSIDQIAPRSSSAGCVHTDTALCLDGRFQVEVLWQTAPGNGGAGHATSLTSESGYFWFFDPSNVELVVKIIDACDIEAGHWFFAAGMTTVGVELKVTDTLTGDVKTYGRTADTLFRPVLDTTTFEHCQREVTLDPRVDDCGPTGSMWLVMQFSPTPIRIRAGDTVVWTFQDGAGLQGLHSHSITSTDGSFDSGVQDGSFTYAHTFNEAGTFSYYCRVGHLVPGWCGGFPGQRPPHAEGPHIEDETGVVIVAPPR